MLFINLKDAHNFGPIKKPSENHTAHVTIYIFKNSKKIVHPKKIGQQMSEYVRQALDLDWWVY